MKPKMLLVGGFGWAGSSPFVYTFQRSAKYAHFGYTKQFRYLGSHRYPSFQGDPLSSKIITNIYKHICNGTWENYKSEEPATHRMNLTIDLEPLHDFSLLHIKKLMSGERSERKYLDFYHALHDHVLTKGYKSVGDSYIVHKSHREDLKEYYNLLMSEFDVKVVAVARDPVRRAFSQYLYRLQKQNEGEVNDLIHKSTGTRVLCTQEKILNQDFLMEEEWKGMQGPIELSVTNYMKKINNIHKVFGEDRTHIAVMEELWEDDGAAKKKLSQFLDHPITEMWSNVFSPDRGHLAEFDKDVPCQAYGQNIIELKPDTYNSIKKQYQYIYDDWKNYYGSLPMQWGEPITYS